MGGRGFNPKRLGPVKVTVAPLVFVILVLAIDFVVDALWGNVNAHTSYAGWSMAVTFAYQHLIPLSVSTGLAGVTAGKG